MVDATDVLGMHLASGESVVVARQAANRDPARWSNPDIFDVTRKPERHYSFGYGAHFCLGNHLARLDMEIIFTTLLRRFPRIELAETPEYKRSLSVRGLKTLRLDLRAA